MISSEPHITIGIIDGAKEISGTCNGIFAMQAGRSLAGIFRAAADAEVVVLFDRQGREVLRAPEIILAPQKGASLTLHNVPIGIQFHWQREEHQTFEGTFRFVAKNGLVTVINEIGLEHYLRSVISSEMNSEAPQEFLKAHAITSRSWLIAMLDRKKRKYSFGKSLHAAETGTEIIRWYDREDHEAFDVCADDHCQRYQGIAKASSRSACDAVAATHGLVLVHDNEVCDARFHKACGGFTELFENNWEDVPVPYLRSIADSPNPYPPIMSEDDACRWILQSPDAFCNTRDKDLLEQILPAFDLETDDFFRWHVNYSREELEEILHKKSNLDFGTLLELIPIERGPSGRIFRLNIVGTKKQVIVGKELEIRKWLSPSHLYSGAFIVDMKRDERNIPLTVALHGAGWGHGVGLCQVGAAVMAAKGYRAEDIVLHYFRHASVRSIY